MNSALCLCWLSSILFLTAPALAQELSPAQQAWCAEAKETRQQVRKQLRTRLQRLAKKEREALAAHALVWFPKEKASNYGLGNLQAAETYRLSKSSRKQLKKWADQLGKLAVQAMKVDMPASAGVEAFRALGLDPSSAKAGKVLGYVKTKQGWVHPRVAAFRDQGLVFLQGAWLPKKLAKKFRPGGVPTKKKWIPAAGGDQAHSAWEKARTLDYPLLRLQTNLPYAKATQIGARVDWFLGWLRARFSCLKGYSEPAWPLELKVYRKTSEFEQSRKAVTGHTGGTPYGQHFPAQRFTIVNDEECQKSCEKTVGIAQHESSHAFFSQAFSGLKAKPGQAVGAGWMVEAFPGYCYYVSPEEPWDGRFWSKLKQKFGNPADPRSKELRRVIDGEDVIGQLNAISEWRKAAGELQSYMAGAVLASYAYDHDELREAYARYCAKAYSFSAAPEDLERLLGPTTALSKRIAAWLARSP